MGPGKRGSLSGTPWRLKLNFLHVLVWRPEQDSNLRPTA